LLLNLMHKVLLAMSSSARRTGTDQILTFFLCCYFPVAFVVIQLLSLWVLRQTSNSFLFLCLQVAANCWTWGANRLVTTALRNVQQLQSEYWLHATRHSMISMRYWREVFWNLTWSLRALRPLARLHLKKLPSTLSGRCRGLFHLQFLGLSFCQEVRVKRKPYAEPECHQCPGYC
jgi:hypothetical protein